MATRKGVDVTPLRNVSKFKGVKVFGSRVGAGALGAVGVASTLAYVGRKYLGLGAGNRGFIHGVSKGLNPGAYYPQAAGRFGTRVGSKSAPVGLEGMRFNFRRN